METSPQLLLSVFIFFMPRLLTATFLLCPCGPFPGLLTLISQSHQSNFLGEKMEDTASQNDSFSFSLQHLTGEDLGSKRLSTLPRQCFWVICGDF